MGHTDMCLWGQSYHIYGGKSYYLMSIEVYMKYSDMISKEAIKSKNLSRTFLILLNSFHTFMPNTEL